MTKASWEEVVLRCWGTSTAWALNMGSLAALVERCHLGDWQEKSCRHTTGAFTMAWMVGLTCKITRIWKHCRCAFMPEKYLSFLYFYPTFTSLVLANTPKIWSDKWSNEKQKRGLIKKLAFSEMSWFQLLKSWWVCHVQVLCRWK